MVRRVATIAERDQVAWLVKSPCSSRDQVMDVRFALGTNVTASPAGVGISSEYNGSDLTPALDLLHPCALTSEVRLSCGACPSLANDNVGEPYVARARVVR